LRAFGLFSGASGVIAHGEEINGSVPSNRFLPA
jgi:hypothetical protein